MHTEIEVALAAARPEALRLARRRLRGDDHAAEEVVASALARVWQRSVRTGQVYGTTCVVQAVLNEIRTRWHAQARREVTELEDGRSFTWRSRSPGADAHGRHAVLDNGDGTSTALVSITQTGPLGSLVALLSRRITKRYVALEAAGLKNQGELRADRARQG